ncbi:unnamed protein product [Blepharisma stoltei]|uniref:Store-operated calcium entry regulator STIMATE n=1 Tax=Blepharisma stoltei TaxID=1481888 RepID=A0AAU9K379_9CILI|nr:unnamed protein product [Blepharisma stoltei]
MSTEPIIPSTPKCELFGDFGWSMQALLGVISFSFLILKRYLDFERRIWTIWFMDTSKQALSSLLTHLFNLALAYEIGSTKLESNPCTWYFLSMLVDAIIGTMICFLLLHGIEEILSSNKTFSFKSGYYGEYPDWGTWAFQAIVWICIVLSMKILIVGVMVVFGKSIEYTGEILLAPLSDYPRLELLCIMIIFPILINGLVFWVTDGFLKMNEKDLVIHIPINKKPSKYYTNLSV